MKRHKHSLSHYRLATFDLGQLVPVGLTEVLPGDTFDHSTSLLLRLSPLAAPVMHPLNVRVHHFFVPHRLIWEEAQEAVSATVRGSFEDFITSGSDGNDTQEVPKMTAPTTGNTLMDYYGVPPVTGSPPLEVSALPLVGFNSCFNEYYADQDLVTGRTALDTSIPNVAWEKDYLTSARPFAQKGPQITLPISGNAPVTGIGPGPTVGSTVTTGWNETGGVAQTGQTGWRTSSQELAFGEDPNNPGYPNIYADLSQAEAIGINEFRRAFALQRYAEARARYGSRYTEYLRYLGIRPSDARLDRPEYLGGGRVAMSVSEVLQTAPEGATPARDYGVADMYGHGIGSMRTNRYRRFFEEHGYVHTFVSVRPKAMYLNGVARHWLRSARDEFWQKELEHIGQQEVDLLEVYGEAGTPGTVFGWQDRYREYRETQSGVSGEFRNLLNYWHLGRDFTSQPALNEAFVTCNPTKRIFNEQTQHSIWGMAQHRLVARRKVARNAAGRIL